MECIVKSCRRCSKNTFWLDLDILFGIGILGLFFTKDIIDKYYYILSDLLIHQESFEILVTNKNELKRIVEYFKQQGL